MISHLHLQYHFSLSLLETTVSLRAKMPLITMTFDLGSLRIQKGSKNNPLMERIKISDKVVQMSEIFLDSLFNYLTSFH